jgi:hypothetical protein
LSADCGHLDGERRYKRADKLLHVSEVMHPHSPSLQMVQIMR